MCAYLRVLKITKITGCNHRGSPCSCNLLFNSARLQIHLCKTSPLFFWEVNGIWNREKFSKRAHKLLESPCLSLLKCDRVNIPPTENRKKTLLSKWRAGSWCTVFTLKHRSRWLPLHWTVSACFTELWTCLTMGPNVKKLYSKEAYDGQIEGERGPLSFSVLLDTVFLNSLKPSKYLKILAVGGGGQGW